MLLKAFRHSLFLWILVLAACGGGDVSRPAAPVSASPAPVAVREQASAATAAAAATVAAATAAPSQIATLVSPVAVLTPTVTPAPPPVSTSTSVPFPASASASSPTTFPTATSTRRSTPTSTPLPNAAPCNDNPLRCTAAPPAGVAAQFSASSVQFLVPNAPVPPVLTSPSQGPAGATFVITFQALRVGQPFYLYRKGECAQPGKCEWRFVATLQAQERDDAGHAVYRLVTRRGDPLGHYLAWPEPDPPGVLGFFPAGSFVLEDGAAAQNPTTPATSSLPTRVVPALPGKLAPPALPGVPSPTSTFKPAALRAKIVSPSPGTQTVTKELVFQVEAYDEKVGARDGAGIDRVDMFVIDSKNHTVHKRTEANAAYCAFGGGEPKCTVYSFGEHQNRWPDNSPIGDTYTLRAVVYGEGGGTTTVETKVTMKP